MNTQKQLVRIGFFPGAELSAPKHIFLIIFIFRPRFPQLFCWPYATAQATYPHYSPLHITGLAASVVILYCCFISLFIVDFYWRFSGVRV